MDGAAGHAGEQVRPAAFEPHKRVRAAALGYTGDLACHDVEGADAGRSAGRDHDVAGPHARADPRADGKVEPRLPLAKHFIDQLAILQEKTKGNLTGHEHNGLDQALHELRMLYVDRTKAADTPSK